jgi:hypothetical protein
MLHVAYVHLLVAYLLIPSLQFKMFEENLVSTRTNLKVQNKDMQIRRIIAWGSY